MALASLSTDATAPPCPVEVDGAGGPGRPAATALPTTAEAVTADCDPEAGAATVTATSASAVPSARPALMRAERCVSLTMKTPRNGWRGSTPSPQPETCSATTVTVGDADRPT